MIEQELLPAEGILVVRPTGPLTARDFDRIRETADGYIAAHGRLNGLMIHARNFDGWDDPSAVLHHLGFVRDHHRKIARVAVVSDSPFLRFAPKIVELLVKAEIREFPFSEADRALAWLRETPPAG
jgi:hypothetical protein